MSAGFNAERPSEAGSADLYATLEFWKIVHRINKAFQEYNLLGALCSEPCVLHGWPSLSQGQVLTLAPALWGPKIS